MSQVKTEAEVQEFLNDLEELCRRHDMSLSHEDGHGSFIIENYSEFNLKWVRSAARSNTDGTEETFYIIDRDNEVQDEDYGQHDDYGDRQ